MERPEGASPSAGYFLAQWPFAGASLYLYAPEGGVGFGKGDAKVPGFVATPDNFTMGAAACFRNEEADLATEREVRTDDGHATGVAHVNGNAIGAALSIVFVPLDLESQAGYGFRVKLDMSNLGQRDYNQQGGQKNGSLTECPRQWY